jgi:hypothetical protein
MLSVCLSVLLLTACAIDGREIKPPPTPVVIDTGCKWAAPIFISKSDVLTDETARQILAHNETYMTVCAAPAQPASLLKEQTTADRPKEKPRL